MDKKLLRRQFTLQFRRGNKLNFSVAMTAYILQVFVNLMISWLLQQFIDTSAGIDTGFSLQNLIFLSTVMVALLTFCAALIYFTKPKFISKAMRQYKDFAFSELTRKGIFAFSKENTATYISAFSNDAASIEQNYLLNIFNLVLESLLFLGAIVMMLCYSPILTAAAIAFVLLPVAASFITGNRVAEAEKEVSEKNESFMSVLRDGLSGFSVIKSFKAEAAAIKLFTESNKNVEESKCRRKKLGTVLQMLGTGAGLISQFGIFILCAYFAVSGKDGITPGVVMIFMQLMGIVTESIEAIPEMLANRKSAEALIDKMAETIYSNTREEGASVPAVLKDGIEISDLCFSYDGKEDALKNINFKFEAGKSYAVVGSSGSGKSTLLNLLSAGNSEYSGKITYDKTELRDIGGNSLYDIISIIQQNVFIFNSSIKDNITMFRNFSEADVKNAVELSGLSELISERGENFLCGENGNGLSGGERQRISIARSLLHKTPVLLVDEATAALDKETSFRIFNTLLSLGGLTKIIVTHALDENLLKKYDCILAMKNGVIFEHGTFGELMERKEYFYSLFTVSQ
ncbi:MAG: ABC transporter ATP-binding protein [Oscillospiraceae bacterium]|nr:ABC transporter ATP-binding protein [Oscillospiraceae bacterium]